MSLRMAGPIVLFSALSFAACGGGTQVVTAPVAPRSSETTTDGSQGVAQAVVAPVESPADDVSDADTPVSSTPASLAPAFDGSVFRDDRQAPPRPLTVVMADIQRIESLHRSTPLASGNRPVLIRQLAEDYVELEKGAAVQPSTQVPSPTLVAARKRTAHLASSAAIRYYGALVTDYSGHLSQTFPSKAPPVYPQLDEAAYYLAYEYERAGDFANARRMYFWLIAQAPGSRYIARCYLAFGEMFFEEAASDSSKWDLAQAAYTKVLASPPPANEAYGYAWYRLALVFAQRGGRVQAVSAMRKAIDFASNFPQLRGATMLGIEARAQMNAISP
jgi:hypothetical protein